MPEAISVRHLRALVATMLAIGSLTAAGCGSGLSDPPPGAHTFKISLSDSGCDPAAASVPAGPVRFTVSNSGSSKVTEFELQTTGGTILGERENVVEGIPASFSLVLERGQYTLACPNGSSAAKGLLRVTGSAASATGGPAPALLQGAVDGYQTYVQKQARLLLTGTRRFVQALAQGDLARARALFGPTRFHYEAIEPVAESFGDLDPEIDARINDVPTQAGWTGFHRIEQILWVNNTTDGTQPYATKLLIDVTMLNQRVRTLQLQPAQLANGAVELLNEVASSKITGEEDRYSHTDLSDFEGNLTGARVAFQLLRPALESAGQKQLAATIGARFAAVQGTLDGYRRPTALGFALYGKLTPTDRLTLAQQVDALAEPLSMVAARVTG